MAEKSNFDILTHILVPKHRILPEMEVKRLFSKYNISKIQLPEMLASDAAAKAIGAKEEDIIEIIRKGATGKEIYFRRVVK